jgi:opacity protein-like surface antigen
MKITMRSFTIVSAVFLMSAMGARALDWDWSNMYAHADAGVSLVQDVTLHSGPNSGSASFDPGVRGDLAIGYNFNDSWAVELESGAIWNSIDSIGGQSLSSQGESFDLYQVPILVNVIYKYPIHKWTPYWGLGIGGVFTDAEISQSGGSASSSDFTFAYQAEAGIKYALCSHAYVDIGYKFFGTLDHDWNFAGEQIDSDALFTHAVVVSFTWTF